MKAIAVRKMPLFILLIASFLLMGAVPQTRAQSRLNDKDVEHLMSNLHSDVRSFRPVFDSVLKKSTIRGTSQEKDARQLARQFEKQTEAVRNTFRQKKKADNAFQTVVGTAQQLDGIVRQFGQQSPAAPAWARVQSDLDALYPAFGLTPPIGMHAY
jgi:regulator of sigma D